MFAWGFYVSLLFLLFAWAFTGQIMFWYLSPFVLFASYLFGDILAKGLRNRSVYAKILSVVSLLIFIFISLRSYSEWPYPISRIQNVINIETAVKEALLPLGISGDQYIEYVNLGVFITGGFPDTSAFWLVRQWKFHEIITYNDPQHSYDPALIRPAPPYRVYVCGNCNQQTDALLWWAKDGYGYARKVSLGNYLWMYIYKRKE
jgi:hypothetical protein